LTTLPTLPAIDDLDDATDRWHNCGVMYQFHNDDLLLT
jgi:hypothetical protein